MRADHRKKQKDAMQIKMIALLSALLLLFLAAAFVKGCAGDRPERPVDPDTEEQQEGQEGETEEADLGSAHLTTGLHGSQVTLVREGDPYVESGAFCFDDRSGAVTSCKIRGEVDTDTPGDYPVTYTFTAADAEAEITRTVRVVPYDEFEPDYDGISVLMYHWIYTADDVPDDLDDNYILDTELEEQLAWLKENEYYHPSLAELRAYVDGTIDLPEKSVVLTFDDARYSFLDLGIPLLEKYEQPAISFVIGANDGEKKIAAYASPYVDFQSHSYDMHQGGGTIGHGGIISAMTQEEIEEDLQRMIDMTGSAAGFAYPYGDVTEEGVSALRAKGILCAFTTEYERIYPFLDPMELPRIRMIGGTTLDGFLWSL